jgi:hypothetical protein
MVARCRPSRRAISLRLRPISIRPHKRHLSSSVRWLYLVPMATPDIAGVALGLWIYGQLKKPMRWPGVVSQTVVFETHRKTHLLTSEKKITVIHRPFGSCQRNSDNQRDILLVLLGY